MSNMSRFKINLLSIVIPAYKQEKTIVKDVNTIIKTLNELGSKYELIIVVDGLLDKTAQRLNRVNSKQVKVIAYEKNQGKGHALRFGMMRAKGDIIGVMDAGMDINPAGFKMLLNHMEWYNADIIVGSKLHPVSRINYPWQRKIMSWGYRLVVKILFGLKIRDTQTGMKFFKRKVVETVLPRLVVKQYAFDIEILAVAYYLGYTRIFEAPIQLDFTGYSSITSRNFWKTIFNMLWDTSAVFYRLHILHYYGVQKRKHAKKFSKQRAIKNVQHVLLRNSRPHSNNI